MTLSVLVQKLKIPPEFGDISHASRETWNETAHGALNELQLFIEGQSLSLSERADVVFASAPFTYFPTDGNKDGTSAPVYDGWVTPLVSMAAMDILSSPLFSPPSQELVAQVLVYKLKPIFKVNPHPHLNTVTGRKLSRAAGGPMAMQDYYEDQTWKQYPAINKVLLWCVKAIEEDAYDKLWHLIIPPVMTLLDDYQAKYKLQGVLIVQEILSRVPADLLKRSGVNGLLKQSLRSSLAHLQSPETADLVRNAIAASVSLIILTTSPSTDRFDELSSLLGEGIISGIWLYSEDKPEVVKATFDALPSLLQALSIGTVRFIKALIPQLTHQIIPQPLRLTNLDLQLSTLRVLDTLLDVCAPRIIFWKETILDALGRYWVDLKDQENSGDGFSKASDTLLLKSRVQDICVKLAHVCPSALQDYEKFLEFDMALFQDMIPDLQTIQFHW